MDYDDTSEQQREALRLVAAYRDLCRAVSKNTTGGLIWGIFMLVIWYAAYGQRNDFTSITSIILLCLGSFEVSVSLWNRFRPSAEGIFFSGLFLFLFGLTHLIKNIVLWQAGGAGNSALIFIALDCYYIYSGIGIIRQYLIVRKIFVNRPSAANLRFFERMVKETLQGDPSVDRDSLDLPTQPTVQAKLFGDTAFVVLDRGNDVAILSMDEFAIIMLDNKKQLATLLINGVELDRFELDRDNWRNYKQWRDAE